MPMNISNTHTNSKSEHKKNNNWQLKNTPFYSIKPECPFRDLVYTINSVFFVLWNQCTPHRSWLVMGSSCSTCLRWPLTQVNGEVPTAPATTTTASGDVAPTPNSTFSSCMLCLRWPCIALNLTCIVFVIAVSFFDGFVLDIWWPQYQLYAPAGVCFTVSAIAWWTRAPVLMLLACLFFFLLEVLYIVSLAGVFRPLGFIFSTGTWVFVGVVLVLLVLQVVATVHSYRELRYRPSCSHRPSSEPRTCLDCAGACSLFS